MENEIIQVCIEIPANYGQFIAYFTALMAGIGGRKCSRWIASYLSLSSVIRRTGK